MFVLSLSVLSVAPLAKRLSYSDLFWRKALKDN